MGQDQWTSCLCLMQSAAGQPLACVQITLCLPQQAAMPQRGKWQYIVCTCCITGQPILILGSLDAQVVARDHEPYGQSLGLPVAGDGAGELSTHGRLGKKGSETLAIGLAIDWWPAAFVPGQDKMIAIIDTGNIDAPLLDRQGSILRSVRCKLTQQRETRHCATCDRDIRARNNNPRLAAVDAPVRGNNGLNQGAQRRCLLIASGSFGRTRDGKGVRLRQCDQARRNSCCQFFRRRRRACAQRHDAGSERE